MDINSHFSWKEVLSTDDVTLCIFYSSNNMILILKDERFYVVTKVDCHFLNLIDLTVVQIQKLYSSLKYCVYDYFKSLQ